MSYTTEAYATTLAGLLRDTVGELPTVSLPLSEALGRRLAFDVVTQYPSPRFDNSQMDGYGIGYANVAGGRFRVGPDVPAGTDPATSYPYGINGYGHDTAVPIMTGAQLPDDVVAVIPVEHAVPPRFVATGEYVQLPAVEIGTFIRKTGEDMTAQTLLARQGTVIDAALIATAASQGMDQLPVTARPRIAVIAGGDEVVTGSTATAAKIFDANTPLVIALAQAHGLDVVATAATTDDLRDFRGVLDALIRDHAPDIVITSGGISEGKYEVVRQLLQRLNVSWVGKVQQQPGGPQGYGVYGATPLIALPGNPISTLVSLRMLLIPAVWQAFGTGHRPAAVTAQLNQAVRGIRGKTQYRRAVVGLQGSTVVAQLHGDAGSHLLAQAVGANALVEIPALAQLSAGQHVTAHLFADTRWDATVQPVVHATTQATPQEHRGWGSTQEKTAQVMIASTRAAAGIYQDDTGPKLVAWLASKGYRTAETLVVADHELAATMQNLVDGQHGPLRIC